MCNWKTIVIILAVLAAILEIAAKVKMFGWSWIWLF